MKLAKKQLTILRRRTSVDRRLYTLGKRVVGLFLFCFVLIGLYTYTRVSVNTASAAPSSTLNFQARLSRVSGDIVEDDSYSIEFKLYSQEAGGTEIWSEVHPAVSSKGGYISTRLGDVTPFTSSIDWSQELWLTMNVNSDGEMSPRLKLTAVPHAFTASQAGALRYGTGTVTADDLLHKAPLSVQSINSSAAGLRLNQTGSGGLIQMQGNGNNVFVVDKSGNTSIAGNVSLGGGLRFFEDNATLTAPMSLINVDNTSITLNSANGGINAFWFAPTVEFAQNSNIFGAGLLFNNAATIKNTSGSDRMISSFYTLTAQPTLVADNGVVTQPFQYDIFSQPTFSTTNGGTWNTTTWQQITAGGTVNAGASIGTRYGLRVTDPGGTGTIGVNYGLTLDNLARGSTRNINLLIGTPPGTASNYSIYNASTYDNYFGGLMVLAGGAEVEGGLTAVGATTINSSGTANTIIGNSTGTLSLASSAFNLSSAGAVSGVTTLSTSGIVTVGSLGSADNDALICRNTAGQLAGCSSTFTTTETAFINNGNSFNGLATLGTNDAFGLVLKTDDTERFRIDADGKVGIGTASITHDSQLHIVTSAGTIGQIVQAANGQTAHLNDWRDGSGNSLLSLTSNGTFTFFEDDHTSTVTQDIIRVANTTITINAANGGINALWFAPTVEFAQNSNLFGAGTLFNNASTIKNTAGDDRLISSFYTLAAQPNFQADGAIVTQPMQYDIFSQPTFGSVNGGTWNTTAWQQFTAGGTVNTGATVGSRTGLRITDPGGTGTITNNYGIVIDSLSRGSNNNVGLLIGTAPTSGNYSIYNASAQDSYFGGLAVLAGGAEITDNVIINDSGTETSILVNKTSGTGNLLTLQRDGNNRFTIFNSGALQINSDATAALEVRNAAGGMSYFSVNSTGGVVQVGSSTSDATAVLMVLDSFNAATDPTGTLGAMYFNTATNTFRCYSGSWQDCAPSRIRKTADQSTTSTTVSNVSGMAFSLRANTEYKYECDVVFRTAATTTGIGLGFSVPSGFSMLSYTANIPVAADGTGGIMSGWGTANNDMIIGTGVQAANTDYSARVYGTVRTGGTAGNLQLRFRSEIGSSSVTVRTGSSCQITQIGP